jgi:hypothetical protein
LTPIRPELGEHNIINLYSLAHTLKMYKLKADIERVIVSEYLNLETCCFYYTEGIRFRSHYLQTEALKKVVAHFTDLLKHDESRKLLSDLPFHEF